MKVDPTLNQERKNESERLHRKKISITQVNKDHCAYRWFGCCINLLIACLACRCHRRPDNDVITMYDHKLKRPKRHVHNHKNDQKI